MAEPVSDLLLVGGGVAVAVPDGGDLLAGQAGEHRPAAAGVGEGLAQGGVDGLSVKSKGPKDLAHSGQSTLVNKAVK